MHTLKPVFNKQEFMNRLVHHPVMSRDPEKEFMEKTAPLQKLVYKKYFQFLDLMMKQFGGNYRAKVILNKLISTKCIYNKAQFYGTDTDTSLLVAGIYLQPITSMDGRDYSEYDVFITGKCGDGEDYMKKTIRKIYAEYEIVPIILSNESEDIYNEFLN